MAIVIPRVPFYLSNGLIKEFKADLERVDEHKACMQQCFDEMRASREDEMAQCANDLETLIFYDDYWTIRMLMERIDQLCYMYRNNTCDINMASRKQEREEAARRGPGKKTPILKLRRLIREATAHLHEFRTELLDEMRDIQFQCTYETLKKYGELNPAWKSNVDEMCQILYSELF